MTASQVTSTVGQTPRPDNIVGLFIGLSYTEKLGENWLPMIKITWDDDGYYYHSYTQAYRAKYDGLCGHVLNPQRGYSQVLKEKRITEILSNRIPHRADSMKQYDLLGIGDKKGDLIAYLARSGGEARSDLYDVFPEMIPDSKGVYNFYFALSSICDLLISKDYTAALIFNSLSQKQKLDIKFTPNSTDICYQGIKIGSTPKYINYLLKTNSGSKLNITVERVNQNADYEDAIIIKLSIKSNQAVYGHKELKPINSMPV